MKQSRHFKFSVLRGSNGSSVMELPQPEHGQSPVNIFFSPAGVGAVPDSSGGGGAGSLATLPSAGSNGGISSDAPASGSGAGAS